MGTPSSWYDPQNDPQNQQTSQAPDQGSQPDLTQNTFGPTLSGMMRGNISPMQQDTQIPDAPDPLNLPRANLPPTASLGMPDSSQLQQPSQGFGGKLKAALQRFAYYGGQAGLAHAGLPTDFDIQKQQMQQQAVQAEIDKTRQYMQMASQMVTLPNGVQMPMALAQKVYPAYVGTQGRMDVQNLRNEGNMDVAGAKITPQVALGQQYVQALQQGDTQTAQKLLGQLQDYSAATGKPNQPFSKIPPVIYALYGPMPDPIKDPLGAQEWGEKVERTMTRMASAPRIAGYEALASSRARHTQFQSFDRNGNVITISAESAIQSGLPSAMVWNSIFGPTGATKTQGQAAGAVADHIPDFKSAVQRLDAKGELGPVMGRINTYLTQGYGGNDPDIAEFVTTVGLLQSGAVRAHFGARGGSQILEKFNKYLNTAQTGPALIGSIDAMGKFLNTYKDVGRAKPPQTNIPPSKRLMAPQNDSNAQQSIAYEDGGRQFNIPANMEQDFLKDHPRATKVINRGSR